MAFASAKKRVIAARYEGKTWYVKTYFVDDDADEATFISVHT